MSHTKKIAASVALLLAFSTNALASEPVSATATLFQTACLGAPSASVSDNFLQEVGQLESILTLTSTLDYGLHAPKAYQTNTSTHPILIGIERDGNCSVSTKNLNPVHIREQVLLGQAIDKKEFIKTSSGWTETLDLRPPQAHYAPRTVQITYIEKAQFSKSEFGSIKISQLNK